MKLDNVFYGFTKNGERKLFLRRLKTGMPFENYIYFDLEEKKYIESTNIDLESLRHITNLIGFKKRMTKRKVLKEYKADNNILYNIKSTFYGNLVTKTTLYDLKTQNGYYMGTGRSNLYDDILMIEVENILFSQVNEASSKVESLITNEKFYLHDSIKSGICVEKVRAIFKEYCESDVMSKKKLLELNYKKKL